MKKLTAVIVLLLLMGSLIPVGTAERDSAHDTFFLSKSRELVQALAVIAGSDYPYIMMNQDIFQGEDPFSDIARIQHQKPDEARVLSVDTDAILSALYAYAASEAGNAIDIPPEAVEYSLRSRALSFLLGIINAGAGAKQLMLSSLLNTGKSYISPFEPVTPTVVFFLYTGNPYACVILFNETGAGIVSAACSCVPREGIVNELLALTESPNPNGRAVPMVINPNDIMEWLARVPVKQTCYAKEDLARIMGE